MPNFFNYKINTWSSFFKLISLFAIITSIFSILPKPVVIEAQQVNPTILIPLDKFVFTPSRENFTKTGATDLEIKVIEYSAIPSGSTCKFTFAQLPEISTNQVTRSSEVSQTTITSTYDKATCKAVLKKEEQKSINIRVKVEITTSKGENFGSYLNFLTNRYQDIIKLVDQNDFTLPSELYVKPEINIILEKRNLYVGDKIKVQIEIKNNDNFTLKELSIKNSIPDKVGKIDCESFKVADERLNGDIIKLPKVEVLAQNNSPSLEGKCILDQFNFEASLASLKSKQITRLNFDITVDKPGKLKFEITTNLDQGRISKATEAIEIIVPTQDKSQLPTIAYIGLILGALAIIGGIYSYYRIKDLKKKQRLNKIISSK